MRSAWGTTCDVSPQVRNGDTSSADPPVSRGLHGYFSELLSRSRLWQGIAGLAWERLAITDGPLEQIAAPTEEARETTDGPRRRKVPSVLTQHRQAHECVTVSHPGEGVGRPSRRPRGLPTAYYRRYFSPRRDVAWEQSMHGAMRVNASREEPCTGRRDA